MRSMFLSNTGSTDHIERHFQLLALYPDSFQSAIVANNRTLNQSQKKVSKYLREWTLGVEKVPRLIKCTACLSAIKANRSVNVRKQVGFVNEIEKFFFSQ